MSPRPSASLSISFTLSWVPCYIELMDRGKVRPEIVSDPGVLFGKPVIKGTRITVEHILEELGHGLGLEDLRDQYPTLTREGIMAALEYAAEVLKSDVAIPAEKAN